MFSIGGRALNEQERVEREGEPGEPGESPLEDGQRVGAEVFRKPQDDAHPCQVIGEEQGGPQQGESAEQSEEPRVAEYRVCEGADSQEVGLEAAIL